ncbi:hypothetical protein LJK87_36390 [Paenibacillus sp. P25]|nr:hypothetical protein LJK87_36390 [Paenibacillus sp. P25]
MIDNKEVHFDVPPVIKNGTTLVQLRPAFEAMGLTLKWTPESKTIEGSKGKFGVKLKIGSSEAQINDQPATELEVAPEIMDGSTMVPLRFIAEATGRSVYWVPDHNKNVIEINRSIASDIYDIVFSDDLKYEGEQQDGKPNGKGKYTYKGQLWYEGDFVQGSMQGQGKLYNNAKLIYEGQFSSNLPNGTGKSLNHGIYEGGIKNGLRHGKGKLSDSKGRLEYEGDFYEDTLTGKGTIYETNHTKYVGDVIMGIREGYAQVYDEDGDLMYEGRYAGNHPAMDSSSQKALAVYLYAKQGKDDKAKKAFETLLNNTEDKAMAYKYLGFTYIKLNKPAEAVDALNMGLSISPNDADFYAFLAMAYTQQGDDAKTQEILEKAKSMGYKNIDQLKEQLSKLKSDLK